MREDGGVSTSLRSAEGRPLVVLGAERVLTTEHWNAIQTRLRSDPRIVSCSLAYAPHVTEGEAWWIRTSAPGGAVTVVASDASDLVGPVPSDVSDTEQWCLWFEQCRDRGLSHDRLLSNSSDLPSLEPWLHEAEEALAGSPSSNIAHALDLRTGSSKLTVSVDATWLGPHETGAQVLTTHALAALARRPEIDSIQLTGLSEFPGYAQHLASIDNIEIVPEVSRADIAWYPNQIDTRVDLSRARNLGHRVVITFLDLIAYDIPRYHGNVELWNQFREQQRQSALRVDGITTISGDVAHRLIDEVPLLDPDRVRAIALGVDHLSHTNENATMPSELELIAERLVERPFILVLGNDFLHKNRDFAIRTWQRLLEQGTSCDLVLAGLHVRSSSSKDNEREALAGYVDLRGEVHTLGHIELQTKLWLLRNASAVHYPTSAEGFGFIPYEAAVMGTPSTFTSFGPLAEFISDATLPVRWSLDDHARDLSRLLEDEHARRERLAAVDAARAILTWDRFAENLVDFFAHIRAIPPVATAGLVTANSDRAAGSLRSRMRSRVGSKSRVAARRLLGRSP